MAEDETESKDKPRFDTAAQVLSRVRWLEDNQEHKNTVEKMRERWRLHSMLDVPPLQPSLTRGQSVIINSPRIMATKKRLIADILSYPTKINLSPHVPKGETRKTLENRAEPVEKAVILAKGALNDGKRVDRATLDHLLISAYCVWVLECRECYDDEGNVEWCWYLDVPAPDTCFFLVQGAPFRPKEFARRFRQPIAEIEARYNGQKNGMHAGKKLSRDGKKWRFEAIGDDKPVNGSMVSAVAQNSPDNDVKDAEIAIYYDREGYIYHVVCDEDDTKTGQVVYCEKSRVKGGPPVIVLSGATSEIRGERLQPFLWEIMQVVKTLNLIDSIRGTRSYNLKPDALIEHDPDAYKAMIEAGFVRPATPLEMTEGGPNIVDVGGKPHWWQIPPDEDLKYLAESKTVELNDYLNQIQAITSEEVLKTSTANGLLLAEGNVEVQQGVMLSDRDWAWAQVLNMWLQSIEDYDEEFELFAKPGESHNEGEFMAGEGLSIGPKDLDGWSWDITVQTAKDTAAIRRAKLEDWARRNELKVSPLEEAFDVVGYSSKQEWLEAMAKDEVLKLSATAHAGFVQAAGDADLLLSAGINAPNLKAFWAPPVEQQPQGQGGGGMQPMRAPETAGVTGGSGGMA